MDCRGAGLAVNPKGLLVDLGSLYTWLGKLSDRRHARGVRYRLVTVLVLIVLAKLAGEDRVSGIAEWIQHRMGLLAELLPGCQGKAPHRTTLSRILAWAVDVCEFEKTVHGMAEAGEPLTIQAFREVYRRLLQDYFGPDFILDGELELECLRIPHFYRAFYVYKYATGLAAAIALSQRVLSGGPRELQDYLQFLRAGCSKFPLDLLRDAGVDMERPQPVETALARFEERVAELERLLK